MMESTPQSSKQLSASSCRVLLCFLVIFAAQRTVCRADVDSGCPSWGCLPWGSFSLSAGAPSQNSTTPWRVELETVSSSDEDSRVPRGCVSDQQTVVCTTRRGYVSVDPTNGKRLWNYTTMAAPYLPIMDIYGDVIGMDEKAMYYVGADGKPKHPITLGVFNPAHSLMVSNNSIMFITGSTNQTAQILTYDTNGIVDGAIRLPGWTENMYGTFIPCSQPIIAGFRAYVMTYFLPNAPDSDKARGTRGMLRLYAMDVLQQLMPKIRVAWYYNFGPWTRLPISKTESKRSDFLNDKSKRGPGFGFSQNQDVLDPIVTFFNGTVYVNVPGNRKDSFGRDVGDRVQPYQGSLWAVRDDGSEGRLLFHTPSLYGPMAVFDTYDNPISKPPKHGPRRELNQERLLWVANKSPAIVQGYSVLDGKVKDVKGFNTIFEKIGGVITSRLSITRSKASPNNDQLVLGTTGSSGQASISVVEIAASPGNDGGVEAELVLSRVVSNPKTSVNEDTQSAVEGQIVNFAFYPPIGRGDNGKMAKMAAGQEGDGEDTWKLGLAAVVSEGNSTTVTRTVVGIF